MTPEQITAMVQALGFPVCVSIAMFSALVIVARWYKGSNDKQIESAANYAQAVKMMADQSDKALSQNSLVMAQNSSAMQANTVAVKEQTDQMRKITADQASLCKAQPIHCHAEEMLEKLLKKNAG